MSSIELRRYVLAYPEHSVNFTIFDAYRFITYHNFEDTLCIRLEWFIPKEYRRDFKIPLNFNDILEWEKEGSLIYKKGNIITYSKEDISIIPSDEIHHTFHSLVREERIPLKKTDYQTLEYPKYKDSLIVSDDQLEKIIGNFKLFQDYLQKQRVNKKTG